MRLMALLCAPHWLAPYPLPPPRWQGQRGRRINLPATRRMPGHSLTIQDCSCRDRCPTRRRCCMPCPTMAPPPPLDWDHCCCCCCCHCCQRLSQWAPNWYWRDWMTSSRDWISWGISAWTACSGLQWGKTSLTCCWDTRTCRRRHGGCSSCQIHCCRDCCIVAGGRTMVLAWGDWQGCWRVTSAVAPTGVKFMEGIGGLCGLGSTSHWIDIIMIVCRRISHSWQQDTGQRWGGGHKDGAAGFLEGG